MKRIKVGLIGNPNSGKTTVFNALTGSRQRVGNWPGVTVDRKSGIFELLDYHVEIIDLPGIYSLEITSKEGAIDARIAAEYLLTADVDVIVNVIDANNLERNLYLTTQLLDLGVPMVLAINMLDVAKKRGKTVDVAKLASTFNCATIALIANRQQGIAELKNAIITTYQKQRIPTKAVAYPEVVNFVLRKLAAKIQLPHKEFLAVRLLEDDILAREKVEPSIVKMSEDYKADTDIMIADARYGMIHELVKQVVTESVHIRRTITAAIDRVVLNRVLGIPVFLAGMYLLFFFAINIGGILQNFFQISSNAIFVHGLRHLLVNWHFPNWFTIILTAGLGKGINTTITFIPVLTAMFLFLAILEATGYMARASFVIDRVMRAIGLPGGSFVPMLVGFGCNVPAIMAARTLENKRDRVLTVMMTPFMSCGARLAIYAVFTAAFFPQGGQNIVFALYIIGVLMAVLTGFILRKTLLQGRQSFLVTELPPYHIPTLRNVLTQTWCRLRSFIVKAGKIIIPICILIAILNSIAINHQDDSLLTMAGHKITPIFKPMGIQQDNWPATVGLVTGVVAKEVVVATLNTLYAQTSDVAVTSHKDIYGQMYARFAGKIGAFAYLLFVLLYFPCIPAIAVMFQEVDWRWAVFSMLWNTGIAYCVATVFYQAATFSDDPVYAISAITTVMIVFLSAVFTMRWLSKKNDGGSLK